MSANILLAIAATQFARNQMRVMPAPVLIRHVRKRDVRERIRELREQMRKAGLLQ